MKILHRFLPLLTLLIVSCRNETVQPGTSSEKKLPPDNAHCVQTDFNSPMVHITGGSYIPVYGRDSSLVTVNDFMLDVYPVTNEQYLAFVKANPQWRRSQVKALFGDGNYLRAWKDDTTLADNQSPRAPVTSISWYAATAYCTCQGKRLPTVDEWEYAGMADESHPDARKEDSFTQSILAWYDGPATLQNEVGLTKKNYYGVYDMYGLVWEWTSDFNSVLASEDTRKTSKDDNTLFCGGASLNASDLRDYAAFMRYSFRGSLKASYSVQNLGFRCASDITN